MQSAHKSKEMQGITGVQIDLRPALFSAANSCIANIYSLGKTLKIGLSLPFNRCQLRSASADLHFYWPMEFKSCSGLWVSPKEGKERPFIAHASKRPSPRTAVSSPSYTHNGFWLRPGPPRKGGTTLSMVLAAQLSHSFCKLLLEPPFLSHLYRLVQW